MATPRERANEAPESGRAKQKRAAAASPSASSASSAEARAPARRQAPDEAKRPAPTEAKGGAQSGIAPAPAAAGDDDEGVDERDAAETLVAMLVGLAQMDSEAAFAYETAAELVDSPDVRARLLEFAGDHRRHVTELGRAIEDIGGEPSAAAPPPDTTVFGVLTSALGMVGPRAVLLALVGNEEFTNAAYDTALELTADPELRQLLQRNFDDEQRHITWLATEARPSDDEEPLATGEN